MNQITKETRLESYYEILGKRSKRYKQIIEILYDHKGAMTAKEVAVEMFKRNYSTTDERNVSAPRLNELVELAIISVVYKKKCTYTNKSVAAYSLLN